MVSDRKIVIEAGVDTRAAATALRCFEEQDGTDMMERNCRKRAVVFLIRADAGQEFGRILIHRTPKKYVIRPGAPTGKE